MHATCPTHPILVFIDSWRQVRIMNLLLCNFMEPPIPSTQVQISLSLPCSRKPSVCFVLVIRVIKLHMHTKSMPVCETLTEDFPLCFVNSASTVKQLHSYFKKHTICLCINLLHVSSPECHLQASMCEHLKPSFRRWIFFLTQYFVTVILYYTHLTAGFIVGYIR